MNETWVTVVGNVADDPRHLPTAAGGMMTAFRLAQTPRSERDGVWTNGDTSFYEVACFSRLGDNAAGSVVKGDPVIVHGKLSMREWQRDEKRGRNAHITATHLGHDLLFGTSTFRRARRDVGAGVPAQAAPAAPERVLEESAETGRADVPF